MMLIDQAYPQEPVQNIRGRVIDRVTYSPLEGASVVLNGTKSLTGTVTDSSGYFILGRIKPGRYTISVSYTGYHSQLLEDILLNSGKERILEIALHQKLNPLDEVAIIAEEKIGHDPAQVNYLSSRKITAEETQRYAATFYDPARAVTTSPGAIATNDQANHLVVRGNSPYGLSWKIEGADVVNPNHLTNAGTVSDKPSLSGGGVAIISTQLLAPSRFLSGAFSAGYGNAISGVFDFHLRDGNNRNYEFTAQASLLGIDLAVEGPVAKKIPDGSFIVNYRYSTLGLFSLAGIPIGDEAIGFQDLSFNLSLPAGNYGDFKIFAAGGKSTTVFSGARDSSLWVYEKDRTAVDFYSDMGVAGINHKFPLGRESGVHTTFAVSGLFSGRTEEYILSDYSLATSDDHKLSFLKRSFSSYYFHKLNSANLLKAGVIINTNSFQINTRSADTLLKPLKVLHYGNAHYTSYQPYLHWRYQAASNLLLNMGLHSLYSGFNGSISVEPRISLKWQTGNTGYFTAGYGLHSQLQHPSIYFNTVTENENLGLTKAHHWVAGFTTRLNQNVVFRSEFYYQALFDVPVLANRPGSFSALNLLETSVITEQLVNEGKGKNYGTDLALERSMNQGFYFIMAGSLYQSLYTGSDGIERNTRYNGNHSIKFTAGREFEIEGKSKTSVYGINLSVVNAGGFRYTPISNSLLITDGETGISDRNAFSEQLDDFFRLDIRLLWRINKFRYTRTIAVDIQNLTNHRNPAWPYFDHYRSKTVFKNQLGILPFISYRLEF